MKCYGLALSSWHIMSLFGLTVLMSCADGGESSASREQEVFNLINRLKEPELTERRKAAESLVALAPEIARAANTPAETKIVSLYGDLMAVVISDKNEDPLVRGNLVRSIGFFGKPAKGCVPTLTKVLLDESEDEYVRSWIAMVLPEIGSSDEIAPAILSASHSKEKNVRVNASQQMGNLKLDAGRLLKWSQQAMDDKSAQSRMAAVNVAAKILADAPDNQEAAAVLLKAMSDPDKMVQRSAMQMLVFVHPDSKDTTTAIRAFLKHSDAEMRIRAAVALLNIENNPKEALLDIPERALGSTNSNVRAVAAEVLRKCGKQAKRTVPALNRLLEDSDCVVRIEAAFSLAVIMEKSIDYLPVLMAELQSKKEVCRTLALRYLSALAPTATRDGQQLIVEMSEHINPEVRSTAVMLLSLLQLDSNEKLKRFTEALFDEDADVRIAALEALGFLRADAIHALQLVNKAKSDPDPEVQRTARRIEFVLSASVAKDATDGK